MTEKEEWYKSVTVIHHYQFNFQKLLELFDEAWISHNQLTI